MSSVDERIVQMKFDNAQFESGVKTTLDSLDNLKKGLDFSGIQEGVSFLQKRFSTMGIAGMEITRRLTNAVIDTGKKISDVTLGQIKSGGMTRALNIEQARFQLQGLFSDMKNGDKQVEKVMASALNAVRGTAYGLDEAAKSASVLAASGVSMKKMEPVLTSIAGAAAMTGRSYEDIGNIYSTVASNGKLMTMQLRQFSAAGLNVSAVLAKHFNTTEEDINDKVQKGKISFDDFSEAMLTFGKQAKRANETFSGSLSNMKAALSRIGAVFAEPYLKNARDVFNALTPAIDEVNAALGPFVKTVTKDMETVKKAIVNGLTFLAGDTEKHIGPINNLFSGLINIFDGLRHSIVPAFSAAFKEMFPNATLKNLGFLIDHFRVFSVFLQSKLLTQTTNLTDGFKGLFTVLKIVGNVFGFVKSVIAAATAPFGGLINIIGTIIGTMGRAIQRFYDFASGSETLAKASSMIVEFVGKAAQVLHDFLTSSKTLNVVNGIFSGIASGLSFLGKALSSFYSAFKDSTLFDKLAAGLQKIKSTFKGLGKGEGFSIDFDAIFTGMFSSIDKIGSKLKTIIDAIAHLDFGKIINAGLVTLVTGSIIQITDAIKNLSNALNKAKDNTLNLPTSLNNFFVNLNYTLKTTAASALNANALKSKAVSIIALAGALLILALAVKQLGKLDSEQMIKGVVGVGILFKMMDSALKSMSQQVEKGPAKKMIAVAVALILFSSAIKSLSKSVARLAELDWGGLARGLIGLGAILLGLNQFLNRTNFEQLSVSKGAGLVLIAMALKTMTKAVAKLGDLNVQQLAKGLISISVLLAAIAGFTKLSGSPKRMVSMGAGLILIATSMLIFYKAVQKLGDLKADEISQGLFSLAIVLGLLTAAVRLMPGAKTIAIGAGLLIMSVGILAISGALKVLSTISAEGIMVALAGITGSLMALGILAALVNPIKLIAASAAIVIFAAGISILTPALLAFSKLSVGGMLTALAMLAGVLLTLGIAAVAIGPLAPMLMLLGAAILVLGAGVTVTAAGLMLLATAFAALAVSAAAGAAALVAAITAIITGVITMVPEIAAAFAEAVLTFVAVIAENAAKVTDAAVKLGMSFLNGIEQLIPKIITTGLKLIVSLLRGIEMNIEILAYYGANIVAKLILGIARGIGTIIQAGIALMFAFVNGLAQGIRDNTQMVIAAAKNMMSAVVESILTILEEVLGKIPVIGDKIKSGLGEAKEAVRDFFDVEETQKMSQEYMDSISTSMDEGVEKLKKAGDAVGEAATQPTVEGFHKLDEASKNGVNNMANNITNGQGTVGAAAGGVSQEVINQLKPSLEEAGLTGEQIDAALGQGMTGNLGEVQAGAEGITNVANAEYDKATGQAAKKAKEQSEAYAKALDPKTAATAAKGIAEKVAKNLDAGKKTALAAGKTLVKEFSGAIEKGGSSAKTAGDKTAKQGASGMAGSGAANNAKITGGNIAQGLINGMNAKQQAAYQAGFALGQKAAQGEKDGADVNSPSKIAIKIGKGLGEGLIIGMNSMSGSVYDSGYEIGNMAANSLSDAMTKVYEILNSDLDMSPKITPVLDLSSIHRGINQMDSMLNTRKLSASVSNNMGALAYSRTANWPSSSNTNNTNNTINITVDGAENPEAFANRLVKQFNLKQRMG